MVVVCNLHKYSCQGLGPSLEGRMSASEKAPLSRAGSSLAITDSVSGTRRRSSMVRGRRASRAEKQTQKSHPRAEASVGGGHGEDDRGMP